MQNKILDIDPGYLDTKELLSEHDTILSMLQDGTREVGCENARWRGMSNALRLRHDLVVRELAFRGKLIGNRLFSLPGHISWPDSFVCQPTDQYRRSRESVGDARIKPPVNPQVLWAQHKYSVLARRPDLYARWGPILAKKELDFEPLAFALTDILRRPPVPGPMIDSMLHMKGYFKGEVDSDSWPSPENPVPFFEKIGAMARRHQKSYLLSSTALVELMAWAPLIFPDEAGRSSQS